MIMVYEVLGKGKGSAIHQRQLCDVFGCSPSELKAAIQREQREGHLICSNTEVGYFIADNKAELKEYIAMMESQAFERLETIQAHKAALELPEGQLFLDDCYA